MKTNPGIKALAVIVSIILMIPTSINWFSFLKRSFSNDVVDASETPLEFKILTDSTAAVSNCLLLETDTISIPEKTHIKGNEYTVTKIEKKAFSYCRRLTNIEIPESVTSIGYSAFENCSNLINIKIPVKVEKIEVSTFRNCSNLKNIEIPESVINIGYSAFAGCYNLDVVVDNSKDNVVVGEDAFKGCKSVRYTK